MAKETAGLMCKIDTGGKAIAYHKDQEPEFKKLNKFLIHYMDDDFKPIMKDGKPKVGLMNASRLKLIGYCD